jgi:hypothetical protein
MFDLNIIQNDFIYQTGGSINFFFRNWYFMQQRLVIHTNLFIYKI